ncbi:hypothetical protein TNCV_2762571 [Trichonephila clavipes]|nr:hypothetical protein TNCV_2762571 [Trichonephila clavipes]
MDAPISKQCAAVVWFLIAEGELNVGNNKRMESVYDEHCLFPTTGAKVFVKDGRREVRERRCQLRCRPRHLTMVQDHEASPRAQETLRNEVLLLSLPCLAPYNLRDGQENIE